MRPYFERTLRPPKLELGSVYSTPGALETLEQHRMHPLELLSRHRRGDWGDVSCDDWESNETALKEGWRVLSCYKLGKDGDDRLWIITEADRSSTTILRPEEY